MTAGRAAHAEATFWLVLPTLPMFLLLRAGYGFWLALAAGCAPTVGLYLVTAWMMARTGIEF